MHLNVYFDDFQRGSREKSIKWVNGKHLSRHYQTNLQVVVSSKGFRQSKIDLSMMHFDIRHYLHLKELAVHPKTHFWARLIPCFSSNEISNSINYITCCFLIFGINLPLNGLHSILNLTHRILHEWEIEKCQTSLNSFSIVSYDDGRIAFRPHCCVCLAIQRISIIIHDNWHLHFPSELQFWGAVQSSSPQHSKRHFEFEQTPSLHTPAGSQQTSPHRWWSSNHSRHSLPIGYLLVNGRNVLLDSGSSFIMFLKKKTKSQIIELLTSVVRSEERSHEGWARVEGKIS